MHYYHKGYINKDASILYKLKLKQKNWGNFWQFFLTGSLTGRSSKNRGSFDCKSIKRKIKNTKKLKTTDVDLCYEWNVLTRRKGEAKWSSMFLLNFSQATKGGMNLFFFYFILRLYLFRVKLKRKLVLSRFSSLKIKMQYFDHNDVIALF